MNDKLIKLQSSVEDIIEQMELSEEIDSKYCDGMIEEFQLMVMNLENKNSMKGVIPGIFYEDRQVMKLANIVPENEKEFVKGRLAAIELMIKWIDELNDKEEKTEKTVFENGKKLRRYDLINFDEEGFKDQKHDLFHYNEWSDDELNAMIKEATNEVGEWDGEIYFERVVEYLKCMYDFFDIGYTTAVEIPKQCGSDE